MKVVIVGGVAGGASTAARLRRLDESAEILIFERGGEVSYSNCALPYHIGGVVEDEEELLLQTPESLWERFRIEVRIFSEVTAVNRTSKSVQIRDLKSGREYSESYDQLVLAPGAEAVIPPVHGVHLPEVCVLRSMEDMRRIERRISEESCRRVVVIGGGFIGLEMAENLRRRNLEVILAEGTEQIFPPFDPEMAAILAGEMRAGGVQLSLGQPVRAILPQEDGCRVLCGDQEWECDLVLLAVGVRPEGHLAVESGLEVNARTGIHVDESLRTSDPDIFAVGDVAEIRHRMTGQSTMLPLAGPANRQGRIAAANLAGRNRHFRGVVGSSVCQVFHQTAACTGLNEKTLKTQKIPYEKVYLSPSQHVSVYPGASPLTMKLLFSPEGKVLGCQCVGAEGVEKRVDVIAAVIQLGGTVSDLAELELCYAPPYSSAKDPVNYAGFLAENVLEGLSPIRHWHDLEARDRETSVLLDVRTPEEYEEGHLEGSRNIPVDELRERLEEIPGDREIWIYCQVGLRGYIAQRILMQRREGQNIYNLSGGYRLLQLIGVV
ncbi:MAG: FAD-dependent oxidoreductase [Lachnospiraceae bacterium]|nr:FAD-dependent oxidoreductase [Lachnospiraceae bacterium]